MGWFSIHFFLGCSCLTIVLKNRRRRLSPMEKDSSQNNDVSNSTTKIILTIKYYRDTNNIYKINNDAFGNQLIPYYYKVCTLLTISGRDRMCYSKRPRTLSRKYSQLYFLVTLSLARSLSHKAERTFTQKSLTKKHTKTNQTSMDGGHRSGRHWISNIFPIIVCIEICQNLSRIQYLPDPSKALCTPRHPHLRHCGIVGVGRCQLGSTLQSGQAQPKW